MEENNNTKIVFTLPGDITLIETVYGILKMNGLEESEEEFDKRDRSRESRVVIIRDAAIAIAQKKIPENKLVELLGVHLEVPPETAGKITASIKEKLIPFAKVVSDQRDTEKEGNFQEELLNKIRTGRNTAIQKEKPAPPLSYLKEVPILDVDKNAKEMEKEGKNVITQERNKFPQKKIENPTPQPQNKQEDKYKESIM